jgi:hypothetical protein
MEMREGSDAGVAKARRLFKRGRRQAESVNTGWARGQLGALLTSWGSLEAERGHEVKALRLLKAGAGANPYNAQAWLMWAHVTSDRQVNISPDSPRLSLHSFGFAPKTKWVHRAKTVC